MLTSYNRTPVWIPTGPEIEATQMTRFQRFCASRTGRELSTYADLHRFSYEEYATFWRLFLQWSGVDYKGDDTVVCEGTDLETAVFFPRLELSLVSNLLGISPSDGDEGAIIAVHSDRPTIRLSRAELRKRVQLAAAGLQRLGVQPGQRLALIARNDEAAIIAALAGAARGAVLATVAPEMGAEAAIERLSLVQPTLLFCHVSGSAPQLSTRDKILEIVKALPCVRVLVMLDEHAGLRVPGRTILTLQELQHAAVHIEAEWPRLPFNHPLFILFSSGTTGQPKAMVHGVGGTLIEHLKEHRLHCDLQPGERLFFQTSTAWMMWNWLLTALGSRVELVLYDGPVTTADTLWEIVAREQVTVFGTSPAYLQLGYRAGIAPRETHDLAALRAILSTGSILYPEQQIWVNQKVKQLPIQSISGGTDIIGCFVLGNPNLPLFAAEPQCKGLGFDLRALASAASVAPHIGELVCANPFPSKPLGFLNDPHGERFHEAYFAQNPGFWTHGDLVEFTPEGSAVMHGRSDGTMNIRGIRIGPAEIYRALEGFPQIAEALAVQRNLDNEPGREHIVLLVVLREDLRLNTVLQAQMRRAIALRASAAHVPEIILQVASLPTTHTGKRSERSVRDVVNGRPVSNTGALRNPRCLEEIASHPGLRRQVEGAAGPLVDAEGHVSEVALTSLWERALHIAPIGPAEDILELGANSLAILRLLQELQGALGLELPVTFIYETRTIAAMMGRLESMQRFSCSNLVDIKPARGGKPLFIVHGLGGEVSELAEYGRRLEAKGPVYAVNACGLDGRSAVLSSVPEMAATYLRAIRSVQPDGPYRLCGYSFGGLVAYEMARQLQHRGEQVAPLILLDTTIDERYWPTPAWIRAMGSVAHRNLAELRKLPLVRVPGYLKERSVNLCRRFVYRRDAALSPSMRMDVQGLQPELLRVREGSLLAMSRYRPLRYEGDVVLLRCARRDPLMYEASAVWASLCRRLIIYDVPGDHLSMVRAPDVEAVAEATSRALRQADINTTSVQPSPRDEMMV